MTPLTMNNEAFIKHIMSLYERGLDIIVAKNKDYANSTNPFRNFESASIVGVSPDRAILVRVLDKLSRISNCLNSEVAVRDETVDDTIIDAINYLAILHAYRYRQKDDVRGTDSSDQA